MEILFFIIDSSPPLSEIKSNPSNIISLILMHESTHLTTINNVERFINKKEKSLLKIKNFNNNKNFTEKSKFIFKYSLLEDSVILGKGEFIINNNNNNISLNNSNNKIITINLNNNNNNSKNKSNFLRLNIKTQINKMLLNNKIIHSPKINKKKTTNFTANISTTNSTTNITKNNTQTQQLKNSNVLSLKKINNSKRLSTKKTKNNKILSHNYSVENGLKYNKNISTENFLTQRNSNITENQNNINYKKYLLSEKKKNILNFHSIKNKILIRNLKLNENNFTTVDNSKNFNSNYNLKNKRLHRSLTKKRIEDRIIDINYKNKLKNDEFILNKNFSAKNIFNFDDKSFFDKKIFMDSDSSLDNNNNISNKNLNNNDENYENIFENKKNSFFNFYTNDYIKSINKETLLLELSLSLEKIFDLQEVYHKNFNKLYKQFKINKNNFSFYSELYLTMNKINEKLNYLKKKNLRNNYKNNLIKKSIKNINNEIIPCFNNKEIIIWKNLINKCSIPENINISPLKTKLIKIFFLICEKNINKFNSLSMKYYKFIYEKYFFKKNDN